MKTSAPIKLGTFFKNKKKVKILGAFSYNERVCLFLQLPSDSKIRFHMAISADGFCFELDRRNLSIKKGITLHEDISLCSNFNISEYAGHFLLTYVRKDRERTILEKAWSEDLVSWAYEGDLTPLSEKGIIVPNYTHKGGSVLYSQDTSIFVYFSKDLINWQKQEKELLKTYDYLYAKLS